jgi:hypothetical protein
MPLRRALCTALIGLAALWAMPSSARAQLYVSQQPPGNTVGAYNATTGGAINARFITTGPGPSPPLDLAVSGNTLFVTNYGYPGKFSLPGAVGAYNATTGAAINANLVTGLTLPYGLALSGNTLFVVTSDSAGGDVGRVSAYNATTGAAINASFITGLIFPRDLAVSGNTLFVTSAGPFVSEGTVGAYNATTGAAIKARFITGLSYPIGLAVAPPVPEPSP